VSADLTETAPFAGLGAARCKRLAKVYGLRLADTHPVQSGLSRRDTRGSVTRCLRKRVRTLTDGAWRRLLRRLSLPRPLLS